MKLKLNKSTEPQTRFWNDAAPWRAFVGGVGSGKTFAGAVEILRQPAGTTGMVLAPTYPMLRDAALQTFKEITAGLGVLKELNTSTMSATLAGNRRVLFRSADNPDRLRGPNLSWIWVDEAAMITRETWLIALGRLRVQPMKIWLTTTPKGKKHWLYEEIKRGQVSVTQAATTSNQFIPTAYANSLISAYDSDWQRQELYGEFIDAGGTIFQRHWFPMVNEMPDEGRFTVRAWDCAATAAGGDYSVGLRIHRLDNRYYIDDVVRGQWGPADLDRVMRATAEFDGDETTILLEREPGSAGKRANQYVKAALAEYIVKEEPPSGSKLVRALPLAKESARGNVFLVKGPWVKPYLDELEEFTGTDTDSHDDQVDSSSLGFNFLSRKTGLVLA